MTDLRTLDDRPDSPALPRPGVLGRLAGVSFRRRGLVLVAWALALGAAIGLSSAYGADLTNGATLPGSDSQRAQDLLSQRFPAQAGDRIDVVVQADDVTGADVRREVQTLLDRLETMPNVAQVGDPYTASGVAQAVSPDGRTLVARLYLDVENPNDMPVEDTERLLAAADEAEHAGLDIALSGGAVKVAEAPKNNMELIGLVGAALILLIAFGSVVAAGLPLAVAIAGLLVSSSLVGLVAIVADVPDFATTLAAILGIAVGIDYTLLIVTRFRECRAAGLEPEAATVATLDTAGRAVLVAGGTVIVSMLGLFAMGLSIMNGTAVVTMVAVLVVVAAATTLLPALLGFLGRWIDRLRVPTARRRTARVTADGHVAPAAGWVRWSRLVQRHGILATVGSVALLVLLALPFLGITLALPDSGTDPEDTSSRQAYDALASGFGPGYNGPLLVVADLSGADADPRAVLERLRSGLEDSAGVASVSAPRVNPGGDAALFTVLPNSGPQEGETVDLVHTVRDAVIPVATEGTGTTAYVGGRTATTIDINYTLVERLPYLIGGVVLVSMLLLLVAFRSVVIPLTAAVMNLLSVGAAFGVLALFLEGGWAGGLIGIDQPTPVAGFVPMIMFALLFGLSMDYEVFLVSRMRETWVRTGDNDKAVLHGLAGTGRVITAAASIMIVVFATLMTMDDVVLKSFGVGMVAAILIDATIVRMLLVPAVMQLLGRYNWWLPDRLDRWLPQVRVEGHHETFLPHTGQAGATAARPPTPA